MACAIVVNEWCKCSHECHAVFGEKRSLLWVSGLEIVGDNWDQTAHDGVSVVRIKRSVWKNATREKFTR